MTAEPVAQPRWYAHPIWTFVGVTAGVIVAGFALFWHFRPEGKAMSFTTSTTAIVANIPGRPSELRVMYGAKELSDAQSIRVLFRNSGDLAISQRDFDGPITLRLEHGELLSAQVGTSAPPGLPVKMAVNADAAQVTISPLLLNPGDQFAVSFIASGRTPTVSVSGRIMGVRTIEATADPLAEKPTDLLTQVVLEVGALSAVWTIGFAAFEVGRYRSRSKYQREAAARLANAESVYEQNRARRGSRDGRLE